MADPLVCEGFAQDSTLRYRYASKERQDTRQVLPETSGVAAYRSTIPHLINFGARMYDPLTSSWLSPDPLAHKYTSWSPYAYCAGNPVNFVDPDGARLYFAKNATEQFKRQFSATVQFMNKRGTSGDIAKLEASEDIYYIGPPERNGRSSFARSLRTIYWDPNYVLLTDENLLISPATILAHEMAHAVKFDAIENHVELQQYESSLEEIKNDPYGNLEERRVITGTEQNVAKKHGEIRLEQTTRFNHGGRKLIRIIEASPEIISKFIFRHNENK